MSYDIYISDYKKTKVLQFPIIPNNLPSISSDPQNEEFETYNNGTFNFIEKEGLLNLTLDSWLPTDSSKYNFVKSKVNAMEIISLIQNAKKNSEPIFIVITSKNGFYVNDSFSVEKFPYSIIKRGDYKYTLEVKQWRDYNTTITTNIILGWNQDSTGWYYYTDTSGNYYKDSWRLIDNEWYSFDPQGYARQSVWIEDGGYWYYLKDSCKMARNEWVTIDGKSYYLGDQGGMYVNSYTPDGYYVGSDGAWIP
jgi:hypothetical protein